MKLPSHVFPIRIAWIWVTAFAGIAVFSLIWFPLAWAVLSVMDSVRANYEVDPNAYLGFNILYNVIYWMPVLFAFGVLIWAYVNSQRREVVTYPY